MVDGIAPQAAQHQHVIGLAGQVRDPVGKPQATLAMAGPLALALQQRRFSSAHGSDWSAKAGWHFLAGQLVEKRLGIEKVDMAGAALHEEKNHPFGAGLEMRKNGSVCAGSPTG